MISWTAFTRLADTNFLMPVAAILAIWLACARAWKSVIWWCLLFGVGLFIVVATKVAYVGWGIGISSIDFTGFSGHAMRATSVAPVLIYILLQRQSCRIQLIGLLMAIGFGIVIGISRVVINAHSVSEVIGGCVLGAGISLGFIWLCRHRPAFSFDRSFILIGLILLMPTLTLKPAPTEHWIEKIAIYLAGSARPVIRH